MSCTACGGSGGKLCSLLKEVGFGFGWDCRANYKLEVHSVLQTKVASTFRIPIETFQKPCRTLVVPWGNYRQYLFQCFAFSTKPQSQHHKRVNNQVAKNTTNDIFIYIYKYNIYIIIYIIPTYSNIRYCNIATMHPASPRPMEIWKNRIVWIWNRESPVFPAANQHTITWQLSHLYLSLYPAVFSINLWRLPSSLHLFSNCLQNCANMCRYWLRNYLRKHGWELPGHSEGWSANPLILHHSTNYCDLFERRCSL